MTRILAVCLGNICRSPSAEAVLRARAEAAGLAAEIDSAGTGDWHVGDPPYGPAVAAGAGRGYDLSALRARQVRRGDFEAFDLILAMDRSNHQTLERMRPPGNRTPVRLFMEYAPEVGVAEVPDPYYTRDFDGALDLIEAAADGLIAQLQNASAMRPKA
ncbi:low molecular weight protein-tyrosine-phosphatase [Rhodophyticola sp. MJ-SS7]|nr:low molecular weight protein-tyrosine-phosphatase [Rhodophyticola sp. MJ-SS7]